MTNYMVNEWVNEFKVRAVCVNNEETFEGSLEWVGAGQTLEGEKQ